MMWILRTVGSVFARILKELVHFILTGLICFLSVFYLRNKRFVCFYNICLQFRIKKNKKLGYFREPDPVSNPWESMSISAVEIHQDWCTFDSDDSDPTIFFFFFLTMWRLINSLCVCLKFVGNSVILYWSSDYCY